MAPPSFRYETYDRKNYPNGTGEGTSTGITYPIPGVRVLNRMEDGMISAWESVNPFSTIPGD